MEGELKNFDELLKLMPTDRLGEQRVCLVDASDEAMYRSKGSDYRLHYAVDLFTLGMVEMRLSGIKTGERLGNFGSFGAGDVVIGDRAYGSIQGMEHLRLHGSDFVIRLRASGWNRSVFLRGLRNRKAGKLRCITGLGMNTVRYGYVLHGRAPRQRRKGNGEVSETQERYNRYIMAATSPEGAVSAARIIESRMDKTARAWFCGKLFVAALCETIVELFKNFSF